MTERKISVWKYMQELSVATEFANNGLKANEGALSQFGQQFLAKVALSSGILQDAKADVLAKINEYKVASQRFRKLLEEEKEAFAEACEKKDVTELEIMEAKKTCKVRAGLKKQGYRSSRGGFGFHGNTSTTTNGGP